MKAYKLIAIILAGLFLLCACEKQETPPADNPSESNPAPSDTTEPTTEATEEPTEEPKADISYYPYRLFEMSAEEIEEECGPLEYLFVKYGGSPTYKASNGFILTFNFPFDFQGKAIPLLKDAKLVEITGISNMIYPGIQFGMPLSEISQKVKWISWGYGSYAESDQETFTLFSKVDNYDISVSFEIPEEFLQMTEYYSLEGAEEKVCDALEKWVDQEYHRNFQNIDISSRLITIYGRESGGSINFSKN